MLVVCLIALAGAVACVLHTLVGFMLTPFFGDEPFFWAHVLASFPLSLGLGLALGQPLRGSGGAAPFRIAAWAGLLATAVPITLAPLTRAILDHNPDAAAAPMIAVALLITLPAAAAAAVLGAAGAIRLPKKAGWAQRVATSPQASVLLFAIGGGLGLLVALPGLAPGEIAAPHTFPLALGVGLALVAAFGLGPRARVLALVGPALCVGFFVTQDNEIKSVEYQSALSSGWRFRVGAYYLNTAGRRALASADVFAEYDALKLRIDGSKRPAAVLVTETLRKMGAVQMTGAGIRRVLDLYLPAEAKPYVVPLLERIQTVRSDGRGTISFALAWDQQENKDEIRITIPTVDDAELTFVFTRDFELSIHVEEDENGTHTNVGIGPVEIEKAGFFESNDTYKTPVRIEDAVLFLDAYLQALRIVSQDGRVVVSVQAQASVGGVTEKVVQVINRTP